MTSPTCPKHGKHRLASPRLTNSSARDRRPFFPYRLGSLSRSAVLWRRWSEVVGGAVNDEGLVRSHQQFVADAVSPEGIHNPPISASPPISS